MGKRSRQSFLSSRLQDYQGSNIEAPNHFISLHSSHAQTVSSNKLRLKNRAAAGTGLRTSRSNRQEARICISGPPKQLHHLALGLTSIINYNNIKYHVINVSPLDYSLLCAIVISAKGRIFTELAVKTSKSLLNWKVRSWLHAVVARVSHQVLPGRPNPVPQSAKNYINLQPFCALQTKTLDGSIISLWKEPWFPFRDPQQ